MKIDDETYQEIKQQFHNNSKTHTNEILWVILWVFALPFVFFRFFVGKTYEYVPDINNLPEPIQTPTSWWVIMDVYGEKVHIDFLAEYNIQWRVFATRNYDDSLVARTVNKISSRDFVLWRWPVMSKKENIKKFEVDEYLADRAVWIRPKYENFDRFNESFGVNYRSTSYRNGDYKRFNKFFSNNHPIWSNSKINLLFKKVRVWDVIRLKWYLVYVHPERWWWSWWPSSMVRDDYGCEIIYVTDITWLKQKK